jgi:hypothetical protein
MRTEIPEYVTHYYVETRAPFLNLSDLSEPELSLVITGLSAERLRGDSARIFGRRYMELRKRTESKLRELFVGVGGQPHRVAPHYFVLGSSAWFEGLSTQMREIRVNLVDLPDDATSFTIPDSFTSMGLGSEYGIPVDPKPHHGKVYRISELAEVIERYGLPIDDADDYGGYQHSSFEKYVEIQLWTDVPVSEAGQLQPASEAF